MIDLRYTSAGCKIAAIVGLFYVFAALTLVVIPEWFIAAIDWRSQTGLYKIATLDLVVGIVLIWAAPTSRSPFGLRVVGSLALLGAVFYALVPAEIITPYLDWWLVEGLTFTRITSILFGLPLGAFILYATITLPDGRSSE